MKKILSLASIILLYACSSESTLELNNLPNIYITDSTTGTNSQIYPQIRPENALNYSDIDTIERSDSHKLEVDSCVNVSNVVLTPRKESSWRGNCPTMIYEFSNITINPQDGYSVKITYTGDSFIKSINGFAERSTGLIQYTPNRETTKDAYTNTKLVLGGGLSSLKYTDFGYWIGVPADYTKPAEYSTFNIRGENDYDHDTIQNGNVFTGKVAAIVYDKNQNGSARELGGTVTLTFDNEGKSQLNLNFDNYYILNIVSNDKSGSNISSIIVNGSNTNGGPALNDCIAGCSSKSNAVYLYYGDTYQAKEASGTFKYTDGNNILLGSFGAKKN